ncbi:MAG: PEP-CTERM sorting domain-containing protein [Akkermansiaceae bacterium]
MNTTTKLSLGLAICSLGLTAVSSAATVIFNGGEIRTAASWGDSPGALPVAGDIGTISVDGTVAGNFNGAFADVTINQDAGTISGTFNANSAGLVWNLQGGTLAGTTGLNFNANSGSIFNLSGGQVNFGQQLLVNSSVGGFNISGDAIINATDDFDLRINQDNGFFHIASDWTGSFISAGDDDAADWMAQLVSGAGNENLGTANKSSARAVKVGGVSGVGGVEITDLNFADYFLVTPNGGGGGSTLTLVPEPSSTALLGLGGLALILRRRK